ncbi:hypothetical protein QBC41DRAFT_302419 [Cercophora samala]|uniref:Uncharacterized protein n=1 Tax=Cercophora samala TaxID=330535 RepID=A0AA40DD21_9PEZI|nr:hypothetical protein QBC41DRAFT_302419 [Cercophora samala]
MLVNEKIIFSILGWMVFYVFCCLVVSMIRRNNHLLPTDPQRAWHDNTPCTALKYASGFYLVYALLIIIAIGAICLLSALVWLSQGCPTRGHPDSQAEAYELDEFAVHSAAPAYRRSCDTLPRYPDLAHLSPSSRSVTDHRHGDVQMQMIGAEHSPQKDPAPPYSITRRGTGTVDLEGDS